MRPGGDHITQPPTMKSSLTKSLAGSEAQCETAGNVSSSNTLTTLEVNDQTLEIPPQKLFSQRVFVEALFDAYCKEKEDEELASIHYVDDCGGSCDNPRCDHCQDMKYRRRQHRTRPQQLQDPKKKYPFKRPNIPAYQKHPYFETQEYLDSMTEWRASNRKLAANLKLLPKAEAGVEQQDSTVQQENTTFTDQRETISDDGYITSQELPNLQQVSMPEDQWHVRNIMSKPIPIWSGDWSTSDTLGKILKQWNVPGDTLFGPHYNVVSTFTFFRGHPTFRFQLNGTKFHAGRLIAAFIPAYQFSQYDDVLYTVSSLTSLPHVILDASLANSGVINLPFVHMNTYFNTVATGRTWQSLGRLVLVVFNKLRAADSSSQNIGITTWVSYDNCELHQPCYAHDVSLPKTTASTHTSRRILAEAGVEGLMKAALPMVKDLVAPELGAIGNVLGGTSNLDKPTDPLEIQRWVPNAVTGLSTGEGIDRGTRLCLFPGSYTVGDADMISTTKDDMNLLELCKIPTRLDLFDWSNTQTTGTRLTHLPTCPNLIVGYKEDKTVKPPVEVIAPPLLAYISRYFKFWRGGLRYKVQIIASQMHTGRIMVAYGAGINVVESASNKFAKMSYLNTYTIDLQEKHEVEFTVPFMAERPWLRCDRFRKFDEQGKTETDLYNWENTGYLDIFVLNRLSHPDSVSSSVAVNVLVSAADDFQLAVPSELSAFQGIGNVVPTVGQSPHEDLDEIAPRSPFKSLFGIKSAPKAEALVGESTVTTRTEAGPQTLNKGSGTVSPAGPQTMSEDAMNMKTLLRRYTKVFASNDRKIGDGSNVLSFPNTVDLSGVNKCYDSKKGIQYRTALAHFGQLFTFWRGSLRYKLVFNICSTSDTYNVQGSVIVRAFHVPGVFPAPSFKAVQTSADERAMYGSFESLGVIVGVTGVQNSLEFEVPFYTPYTQLRTFSSGLSNSRSATGTVYITVEYPSSNASSPLFAQFDLYQAAGDDFALNYLRAAPRVQFASAFETTRIMQDNALGIHSAVPNVCSGAAGPTPINSHNPEITRDLISRRLAELGITELPIPEEREESLPKAEALSDYIPGFNKASQTLTNVNSASIKVESVCDTANHILQQAAKKLGVGGNAGCEDIEDEDSTTLLEDVSSLCTPIVPILESVLQSIRMLPSEAAKYFRPEVSLTELLVDVANLVSGFTAFGAAGNVLQKICAVVTIVSTLLKEISTVLKNQLYHFATQVITQINGCKQGNQQPQAESEVFDLVAPLTATLAVAVGAIGFKKIPSDKETIDLCRGISEKLKLFNFSSSALNNVKGLWAEVRDLLQWCIDYIMQLIAPQMLANLKLQQEFSNIDTWAEFIDSLDNIAYTDKIHYDYEFRNKIYRAIDQGKKYNVLLLEGKCGRAASVIREYVRKVTEIGLHCERSKNELPFRKDPFCVAMFGQTDIGKSGCITTVGFDIMDELGYPLHNRWCAVNCTEKFFSENYRQQSAVYFDDFGTFTCEEQYQKFFNLKANTAYPLDMAFRKGEYFNSDFIFMTTNTPYPAPNFVTNHDALLRRRDLLIEAEWEDANPEIAIALAERRDMAPYRQVDNSHLRFRFRDNKNSEGETGPWMTYNQMVQQCVIKAREHMTRQQNKLTHDLTRAGYIVPQAESGVQRRICVEAAKNSPSLSLFNPDLWPALTWEESTQRFVLYSDGSDILAYEWETCKAFFVQAKIDLHKHLIENSYVVKKKITLVSKITTGLTEFKELITHNVNEIMEAHPWIKAVGKWTMVLVGAVACLGALWFGTKKIVHACACKVLRTYGYRCGFCGKWPAWKNVTELNKPFMFEQWKELYGDTPYMDFHVTPPTEEAALLSLNKQMKCEVVKPYQGTKAHAEAVYSDVTKGSKTMRISAQTGIYNQHTQGQKITKVTAQSNTYNTPTKGQASVRVSAEACQAETVIQSRVFPYIYKCRTQGKPGVASMNISCYAIGQRWVLINAHFFHGLEDSDLFEIYHNGAWMPVEYLKERSKVIPKKDLCIYEMPMQFHAHKDNTRHFISEKELQHFRRGRGCLCKLDGNMRTIQVDNLDIKALQEVKYEMETSNGTVPLYVQSAWKYAKCSSFGDCGSPLVAYSDKLSGKILGIHIASDENTSYSQLVTREMLEDLVERKEGTPLPKSEAKFGNLIPSGHLGRIGKAPKGKEFYQSPKTEIIPTAIQGKISKPTTFPAVLSINDERLLKRVNPLRLGIEKYSYVSIPFPKRHREIVNVMMKDEVKLFKRSRDPEPLTLEEACNGIPEMEGYERLPRNTSPGYPWILTRPKGACGKDYLFQDDLPIFELSQSIEMREQKARSLERVESVWVDCLKDERRPEIKIQQGSTRVFTIPPVDFSILMRKYTLDFSVAVKNSRDYMDCKVGIDPQSLEWTTLYYWLAEFSPFCVAGDFSRFDGSMPADLIDDVREDIDEFYEQFGQCTQEDKNVRKTLFDELIHTVHIARDEFYMTHIGNKSGNPITVILNSRINKRYMALAWLGLVEKFQKWEFYSMAAFQQNVRMAIYGDDNLLSIKPEVVEWYNQETISEYLAQYKIIYTNEEKTGITKFKQLDQCSFLKQTFHNHESLNLIKVPHMKQQTILELLNWTRVAPDQDELLFDNCNDALRFAYFYGKRYFEQLREKIIAALTEVGKNWIPKTYMDFHLWFLVTIGALKGQKMAEGFLTDFAHTDTPTWKKMLQALTIGPLVSLMIGPQKDDGRIRTAHKAVCIPSGEGKTWLCQNYPHLFVDHDDLSLPILEAEYGSLPPVERWTAIGNALLNPQRFEVQDENDKRILLTHHPNTTNRTIIGKYILPYPTYNRNNILNRQVIPSPKKMPREERNAELIALASRELQEK